MRRPRAAPVLAMAGLLTLVACGRAHTAALGDWGNVTSPVFGTSEQGVYAGAELFAGPAKFDATRYHAGVLPNGRIVMPAGQSVQIGMNPLGAALTPDGRYLVTTNDDERNSGVPSLQGGSVGGYSLSVLDTSSMQVVSQVTAGRFFVGIAASGDGPYTLYASGGPDNDVKIFTISAAGAIAAAAPASISIPVITPPNAGFVSSYTPDPALDTADASGDKPPVPSGFSRTGRTAISYPAGLALSPDGRFLYVACNGDNSLAVVDTASRTVVKQLPVGYFPYGVAVSADGSQVFVSNWGVTAYRFRSPTYDPATGALKALGAAGQNQPDGFYVPPTDTAAGSPKTSSVWVISIPGGDPKQAALRSARYLGKPLDDRHQVGDTHPSAVAIAGSGADAVLYVAKSNDDAIAVVAADGSSAGDLDLSVDTGDYAEPGSKLRGAYPNAIAVSHAGSRAYVAEAGINAVAVLDITRARAPKLLGRIPTGWYPTALAVGPDDRTLYVINAKGVGEDLNPKAPAGVATTGLQSFPDGNTIFGTAQKIDLASFHLENATALSYNHARQGHLDSSIVPVGGGRSKKIAHVVFILHENKTFDSMLGSMKQFGPFASTTFAKADGTPDVDLQYTPITVNTRLLASRFATAVNYYSDSEESDAGHQFAASGTATDYTEKTLLVKNGRGLLVNKNAEPEDYPASGYIFNNAARHGVSFKDYGALVRIAGTDTGTSTPTTLDDPGSGNAGYPGDNTPASPNDVGDTISGTSGLGQSYFMQLPALAILGTNNPSGEARIDRSYPGYNFNVSDQRRAAEFMKDFDRMVAAGTVPDFLYVYQPNDHTGAQQAKNVPAATAPQQVADGDAALGMVVQHIMKSPLYYDPKSGEGTAIFITWDDSQSTSDHIHPHRTPLVVVSPYAKPGAAKRHYCTASVVKTEELLLGLPPNNLGDLFATDLRDMFQAEYNGITADQLSFNTVASYRPSPEGRRIWKFAQKLDTSAPDRDSRRLGALGRLTLEADRLHAKASARGQLGTADYRRRQLQLLLHAQQIAATARRDADD